MLYTISCNARWTNLRNCTINELTNNRYLLCVLIFTENTTLNEPYLINRPRLAQPETDPASTKHRRTVATFGQSHGHVAYTRLPISRLRQKKIAVTLMCVAANLLAWGAVDFCSRDRHQKLWLPNTQHQVRQYWTRRRVAKRKRSGLLSLFFQNFGNIENIIMFFSLCMS